MKDLKDKLLNLYSQAIDSGLKEFELEYNQLLAKTIKDCIKDGNDSVFLDIALETEYETQFNAMVRIRKQYFNYEEHQKSIIALCLN